MGCWDECCALTGLPIFGGDPVVVFVFREKWKVNCMIPFDANLKNIENILKGTYDTYGYISEVSSETEVFGEERPNHRAIHFHRWAWDEVLSLFSSSKNRDDNDIYNYSLMYVGNLIDNHEKISRLENGEDPFSVADNKYGHMFIEKHKNKLGFMDLFQEFHLVYMYCDASRIDIFQSLPWKGSQNGPQMLRYKEALITSIKKFIK